MKLLVEAAAKKYEREHNARVWLAWHVAALHRMKKLPDIKRMFLSQSSRPRQTWRQQLMVVTEWANRVNDYHARMMEQATDGR
jgi:hypothetical protein